MGADFNQTLLAMKEAESYPGPSLIIAYAPCINHGIKTGMATSITEEKKRLNPDTGIYTATIPDSETRVETLSSLIQKSHPEIIRNF